MFLLKMFEKTVLEHISMGLSYLKQGFKKEKSIMKFIYPAVFHKKEDGTYEGYFPDLECCYAKGDTLEDAVENANEAANDWISLELTEEDPQMPAVSDIYDMNLNEGDIVRNISVTIRLYEGWDE